MNIRSGLSFFAVWVAKIALLGTIIVTSLPSGASPTFARTNALLDPQNRISAEFDIPEKLQKRTQFWFDIYTLYGAQEHVIHHTLYPWIVYKVVDTRPIFKSSLHKWTKHHKAEAVVKHETQLVRKALSNLAKRNSYNKLSPLEKSIFVALQNVPGSRKKILTEAARNLRVQLGQKDFFLSGLNHSARYLQDIEDEFLRNGLPLELTRLPFVESSFNIHAQSKVGASGIWQIMPTTGKTYLLVTDHIDERNSPLKASRAAVHIFKSNFRALKNWPLAVTAYNHGASGIKKALKISRTANLPDLVERYHAGSFKFASANFYTSFLAVMHAQYYHQQIFTPEELAPAPPIDSLMVLIDRPIRFQELVQQIGIAPEAILEYNLDLKRAAKKNARIPKGYKIILPSTVVQSDS